MASLKEIRSRITSVNSTMQITSAMKMVSASKLRRAQEAITQLRPYANKLKDVLSNVSASLDTSEGVFSQERTVEKALIIAVTSNRGLCGGFNNNVIKAVNGLMKEELNDVSTDVLCLGKKGLDVFSKTGQAVSEGFPENASFIYDNLSYDNVADIAQSVMDRYEEGTYDRVIVVYNRFKNAAMQIVERETVLPMTSDSSEDNASNNDYIFEPNKAEIVDNLIPKSIKIQVYKAVLDSHASEHGARMTAMHKATDNGNEMLKDLKIVYNKERQAAITGEILEIVGGAEALNG